MSGNPLLLSEFITRYPIWGNWKVSYTDRTHLPDDKYVTLGTIAFECDEQRARLSPVLPFVFQPAAEKEIKDQFPEQKGDKQKGDQEQALRASKIIREQMAESLMRTGLLRPELWLMQDHSVQTGFLEVLRSLSENPYLLLVVDTGALRRGIVSFLYRTLPEASIWTVVPVFVMMEVQHQIAELNREWRKIAQGTPQLGKCDVLEKRPQVSCTSRELNYIRRWRPVEIMTTRPELLSQSSETDRLIIESVKNLKRERGLHRGVYLLTTDKDMASLAVLEGVNTLCVVAPPLPDVVSSVRYDSWRQIPLLSSVHYLLWDLTQVFSTIQVQNQESNQTYTLNYYSEARGGFFAYDILEIQG